MRRSVLGRISQLTTDDFLRLLDETTKTHLEFLKAVQLLNRMGEAAFSAEDEKKGENFAASMGVILESWVRITDQGRSPVTGQG